VGCSTWHGAETALSVILQMREGSLKLHCSEFPLIWLELGSRDCSVAEQMWEESPRSAKLVPWRCGQMAGYICH
jgi:hypothetical protein